MNVKLPLLFSSEPWIGKAINFCQWSILWIKPRPCWHFLPVLFFLFFPVCQTILNSTISVISLTYFLGEIVLKQLFQENIALYCCLAIFKTLLLGTIHSFLTTTTLTIYSPVRTCWYFPSMMIHLIALILAFFLCSHTVSVGHFCTMWRTPVLTRSILFCLECICYFHIVIFVSRDVSPDLHPSLSPHWVVLSSYSLIVSQWVHKVPQVTGGAFIWMDWKWLCALLQKKEAQIGALCWLYSSVCLVFTLLA